MIASERSLASSHQPQTPQHRKQSALGKARNGAAKPPVRPVKIYVIDPRKLQQRLEAYVDQKNQKRAAAEKEKEKEEGVKSKNDEKPVTPTPSSFPVQSTTNHTSSTQSSTSATKSAPPKLLPVLAPKLQATVSSSPNLATNGLNLNQQESALGNGVTFQSLQCINAAGLGIPALPLVVTNGVALIQPAISSQSSISTSGLFLPGLTAIPSVINGDGTLINQTSQQQQQALQTKAKQKLSTTQKRKAKKKKAAKKRKVEAKERDDEEADRELSYLLKETTTRLGRVSRPVSQPHSPSIVTSLSSTSSRAPSPKSKLKKKVIRKKVAFRCENCVQSFVSREQLNCHYNEFPHHQTTQERDSAKSSIDSLHTRLSSTNFDNQGTQLRSPPLSHSETIRKTNTTSENGISSESLHDNKNINNELETTSQAPAMGSYGGLQENIPVSSNARVDTTSLESLSRNVLFSAAANINKGNIMTEVATQNGCLSSSIENDTGMHASLVPSNENQNELFQSSISPSNVVQVPSSYSIPSSPPSRCQSPGLPDNMFTSGNLLAKERAHIPMGVCNSPVDPMLLRSRSPFPPPIPETSSHSVGASNLSIPEESLCKGELFMDLGDGVLENSRLSAISPTPFGNESSIDHLFSDSGIKEAMLEKPPDVEITDSNPPCTEQSRDFSSNDATGPSIRTPMLLESTMEDANDGEIFQTANYARTFLHPSLVSVMTMPSVQTMGEERILMGRNFSSCPSELPRTPQSTYLEGDVSMDSSETQEHVVNSQKSRSVWHFVKDQIKFRGISQVLYIGQIHYVIT